MAHSKLKEAVAKANVAATKKLKQKVLVVATKKQKALVAVIKKQKVLVAVIKKQKVLVAATKKQLKANVVVSLNHTLAFALNEKGSLRRAFFMGRVTAYAADPNTHA